MPRMEDSLTPSRCRMLGRFFAIDGGVTEFWRSVLPPNYAQCVGKSRPPGEGDVVSDYASACIICNRRCNTHSS